MMRPAGRLLMLAAVAVVLLFAWLGTLNTPGRQYSLDAYAQRYVDQGLKRALLTFATARTLEGIMSVAQATAVAFEPAGIGVQLGPGQLIRPLNDLVAQFAELTLMASIVFGAMEIFLRIGNHWVLSLGLSFAVVGWAAVRWRDRQPPAWLAKTVLVLLLIRFGVPIVSLGNEHVYAAFMAESYVENQGAIQATSEHLEDAGPKKDAQAKNDLSPKKDAPADANGGGGIWSWLQHKIAGGDPESKAEPGMLDRIREWAAQKVDVGARLKNLVQAGENLTERIVRLMVVFVLQTLVIPLLLAWALVRGAGAFFQARAR